MDCIRDEQSREKALQWPNSKHVSTPNPKAFSSAKIGEDVRASTAPVFLQKRNRALEVIDVDEKRPAEPLKSSRKANQAREGQYSCYFQKNAQPPRLTTKCTRRSMKTKTAEKGQSENSGTQPGHFSALKTELGVFDDLLAGDLPPGGTCGPEFVSNVLYNWTLNCRLPLRLCNEAFQQLIKTSYLFLYPARIHLRHRACVIFDDQDVRNIWELAWFWSTIAELDAMEIHWGDFVAFSMRTSWELCIGYVRSFSLHKMQRWWTDGTTFCMALLNTTVHWKWKQARMNFFIPGHGFQGEVRKAIAVCLGDVQGAVCRIYKWAEENVKCHCEQRRLVSTRKTGRRIGKVHIHFKPAQWTYGREGHCVESEASCSSGIVVEMAWFFDGLGRLHPASDVLDKD